MRENASETLADIVTEFREMAHQSVDGIIAVKADAIADRIEAACKRERDELVYSFDQTKALCSKAPDPSAYAIEGMKGFDEWKRNKEPSVSNSAALREAVVLALSLLDLKEGVPYKTVSQKDIDFMKAALSAPPRNCNVGTAEEQYERHTKWCSNTLECPCAVTKCRKCFAYWAQKPYEAEEGGEK